MATHEKRSPSNGAPPEPGLAEDGDTIDATNFRFHAKRVIEKYVEGNKIIDVLVWGTIVRHYEELLAQRTESRE